MGVFCAAHPEKSARYQLEADLRSSMLERFECGVAASLLAFDAVATEHARADHWVEEGGKLADALAAKDAVIAELTGLHNEDARRLGELGTDAMARAVEIAALRQRVEELERRIEPKPREPFEPLGIASLTDGGIDD
jgi:hypothetical protein